MTVPSLEGSMLNLTTMSFLLGTIFNIFEANKFWATKTQTGAGQSNPGDCKIRVEFGTLHKNELFGDFE